MTALMPFALVMLAADPLTVVSRAHDAGTFDGEVLISRHGTIETNAVLGLADREHGAPHVVGERWRWASVTKQLTAVLVMQEVERGHLTLDTTLAQALPAFTGPTRATTTIRMLLQHTSGLPNPDDTPALDGGMPAFYLRAQPGPASALGYCAGAPKPLTPGRFAYNNCDYLVLGAVLERVTTQRFPALITTRFARPLRLETLEVAPVTQIVGTDAAGRKEPDFSLESFGAAGALGGSASDLFRFDEALRTGRLLSKRSLATLWKGEPSLGFEALGQWSYDAPLARCAHPVRLVERRGDIGGVQVVNVIVPEQEVEVLLFSNTALTTWGEVWQGRGLLHDVLSAALCEGRAERR